MRAALILALSLSYAAPALSQPANQAAEREARGYLVPCNQVPAADRPYCKQDQADFVDDYVHAMAGDPRYIEDLTRFFTTWVRFDVSSSHPGIRQDRQEGCAWLQVEAAFTPSKDARDHLASNIYQACIDFTAQARLAIWLRATDLVEKIHAHPTTPPPEKPYVLSKGLITTVPDGEPSPKATSVPPGAPSLITAMPNVR